MNDQERVTVACPNGHRSRCPRSALGRHGTCPKCRVEFPLQSCPPPSLYEQPPISAPPDPKADYYRRLGRTTDLIVGIAAVIGLVLVTLVLFYLSTTEDPGRPRFARRHWLMTLLGWKGTWIVGAVLCTFLAAKAWYQLLTSGKVYLEELDDMQD